MSRTTFATHIVCDACGATEQMAPPSAGGALEAPPGWLPPGFQVVNIYHTALITDLCAACMGKPLAELLEPHLAQALAAP